MIKRVVCVNDEKQPPGAEVVEGREYNVVDKFINNFDQIVYILEGVNNKGTTKYGLPWVGYSSTRFADLGKVYEEEKEYNFALN